MAKYFLSADRLENRTGRRQSNIKNRGQCMGPMEETKKSGLGCRSPSKSSKNER